MDMQEEGTQGLPREDGLSIPDPIRISLLWLSFRTVTDLAGGAGSAFLFPPCLSLNQVCCGLMTRSTPCWRSQLVYQVCLDPAPCAQLKRDGIGSSLVAKGGKTNKQKATATKQPKYCQKASARLLAVFPLCSVSKSGCPWLGDCAAGASVAALGTCLLSLCWIPLVYPTHYGPLRKAEHCCGLMSVFLVFRGLLVSAGTKDKPTSLQKQLLAEHVGVLALPNRLPCKLCVNVVLTLREGLRWSGCAGSRVLEPPCAVAVQRC